MENLRQTTLMERSKIIEITLRWNPEKFVNGHVFPDMETVFWLETANV